MGRSPFSSGRAHSCNQKRGFHCMDGLSRERKHSRKGSKCRYSSLYPMINWMIGREAALGIEKQHCIMETS
jgi:hypothetical protein